MANYTLVQTNASITGSRFRWTRADGEYWEMPTDAALTETGLARRVEVAPRLRRDGGTITGDETFGTRKYNLTYHLSDQSEDNYSDSLNQVEAFFRANQRPYILTDATRQIRAEFAVLRHSVSHPVGNRSISSTNTLAIEMVDALWESVDEYGYPGGAGSRTGDATTGGTGTGSESGVGVLLQDEDEITISNPGRFDVYPVWYIIPQSNVITFTLRNTTTDAAMTFDSSAFVSGVLLKIDTVEGTITVNGVDRSSGLTAGGLISLQPGNNTIRYESTGGDVTLEAVWRLRYGY